MFVWGESVVGGGVLCFVVACFAVLALASGPSCGMALRRGVQPRDEAYPLVQETGPKPRRTHVANGMEKA